MTNKYLFVIFLISFTNGHEVNLNGIPIDKISLKVKRAIKETKQPNVWPFPQSLAVRQSYLLIDSENFNFIPKTIGKCDLLDKAIQRYQKLQFLQDCSLVSNRGFIKLFDKKTDLNDVNYRGNLTNITVQVTNQCEDRPHMYSNETYSLEINEEGNGFLVAESVWGAIYGLETLSQLLVNVGLNRFIVNLTVIVDYPRFSHRGLMLDTSRHYLPTKVLLQNLDAMVYNKLNVFHWHIVDDQSFPYVSQVFPQLSQKGAYNPKTHIYTPEDINTVIEYARERAIRVLVEFDTPGHTQSWGKGQPGLLIPCYTGTQPNGAFGPIDPSKKSSYDFIQALFTEVTKIFPDQYLHLGGDESDFSCCKSNPNLIKFMQSMNITGDFAKLEEYYIQNILSIVKRLKKSSIIWQDVFDNNVEIKSDTIVHIWRDKWESEMFKVTNAGYQSLLSSCWYLNVITYGTDWPQYYACDPQNFGGTEQQNQLVIGGEACMWGEWIDATNLISTTWPRAIAVAERLWSSQVLKDPKAANDRFDGQHCRMQQRGLDVEPANGIGFCQCDYAV